jgi:hypothetical protein
VTETQQAEVEANPANRTYEPSVGKLAAALAAVQAELPPIRKAETGEVSGTTKDGKHYSYKYSYADLAAVSAAVMPLLGKNGLAFTAWPTAVDNRLLLRYYLLHESGERMDGEYPLPTGGTAQQLGSAITYARRYCLCAVTGVAPDDDDDAAAADGKAAAQQAAEKAEQDKERELATQSVMGAWANQFGGWDPQAATLLYGKWSNGGEVATATPKQLRAFTGYLLALPAADAGSTPGAASEPDTAAEDDVRVLNADEISGPQRGMMFALFEDLGWKKERQRQLEFLSSVTGRPIRSRSQLRPADMDAVLRELEARVAALPTDVSGPAPAAQSADGETRVPAGPDTQ